jgi:hypothetical protein
LKEKESNRIRNKIFREVRIQNLLTEFEYKWFQWFGRVILFL